MMKDISAFAIFCEDIRREAGGRHSIIGTYSDTMEVPSFPGALRRLGVFFRIRFDVNGTFDQPISVDLEVDNGEIVHETPEPIGRDLLERSLAKSRERGMPYTTITGRMEVEEPVHLAGPCRILALLKVGDEREVCGILNLRLKEPPSSAAASASPPPS